MTILLSFAFIGLWSLRICSGPCNILNLKYLSGSTEVLRSGRYGMPYACRMPEATFFVDVNFIPKRNTAVLRIRGGGDSSVVANEKSSKIRKSKSKDSLKKKRSESLTEDKKITKVSKLAKSKSPKKKSKRKSRVDWDTWRKVPKGKSRYGTDVVSGTGPRLYQVLIYLDD
jgi:hypothetical protein